MKRLLVDNVDESGNINTDAVMRGMLQLRNTPECDSGLSPAQVLLGRSLRDSFPAPPPFANRVSVFDETSPDDHHWKDTWRAKENALCARLAKQVDRLDRNTRKLAPLFIGDSVRIQNQSGNHPNKWDKTSIVIQIGDNDQYTVRVDGLRRLNLRNRRFLKKFQRFAVRAEGEVRSIPPHREPLDTDSSPSLETRTLPDDYMAPQRNQHNIISKHGVREIEESATPAPVDKLHEIGRTARTASDFVNPPARSDITSPEPKASDPPTSHPDASPVPAQVANPALDTVLGRPKRIRRPPPKFGGDDAWTTGAFITNPKSGSSYASVVEGAPCQQGVYCASNDLGGGGDVRLEGPLLCTLFLRIVFVTCVN